MVLARTTARVFFALPIDAAVDAHLDSLVPRIVAESDGRAVPAGNLHATLAFIGAVTRDELEQLIEIGSATAGAPFDLALDTVGSFKGARVAWLAPSRLPPALMVLHEALTTRLRAGSFRVEDRPFHPHVTLARHCRRAIAARTIAPIAWRVRRMVLYESVTMPQGPRYEPRAAWPFDDE